MLIMLTPKVSLIGYRNMKPNRWPNGSYPPRPSPSSSRYLASGAALFGSGPGTNEGFLAAPDGAAGSASGAHDPGDPSALESGLRDPSIIPGPHNV